MIIAAAIDASTFVRLSKQAEENGLSLEKIIGFAIDSFFAKVGSPYPHTRPPLSSDTEDALLQAPTMTAGKDRHSISTRADVNDGAQDKEGKRDNERGAAPNHDGREEMEVCRG